MQLHWLHRLLAFAFFFHLAAAFGVTRRSPSRRVARAVRTSFALVAAQLAVAAAMILTLLPRALQGLHLAVGVAVWCALVVWAARAQHDVRAAAAPRGPTPAAVLASVP
jgi:heme A synthase